MTREEAIAEVRKRLGEFVDAEERDGIFFVGDSRGVEWDGEGSSWEEAIADLDAGIVRMAAQRLERLRQYTTAEMRTVLKERGFEAVYAGDGE